MAVRPPSSDGKAGHGAAPRLEVITAIHGESVVFGHPEPALFCLGSSNGDNHHGFFQFA